MLRGREVEVKYRVQDLQALSQALLDRGFKLSPPVHQDDQAYAQLGWRYGMSKVGATFARLRTEGERHIFTVKKPLHNEMSCIEHESDVSDRIQMHHAILAMGFYPTVRIEKSRRVAHDGDISLCLDDVVDIGVFLEIEKLVGPEQSGETVQEELHRFAVSLGVAIERTTQTYDSIIRHSQRLAS